jgi:hypothetical protein
VILKVDSFKKSKHNNNLSNFEAIKIGYFDLIFLSFSLLSKWSNGEGTLQYL